MEPSGLADTQRMRAYSRRLKVGARGEAGKEQLGALLDDACISRKGLARRVVNLGTAQGVQGLNYDHSSVARWLAGQQPREPVPELIAEVLAALLHRPVTVTDLGMVPSAISADAGLRLSGSWAECVATGMTLWRADVEKRQFLQDSALAVSASSAVALQWLVSPSAGQPSGLGGRKIGASDVAAMERATQSFREMDNRLGGGRVRSAVMRYLTAEITPVLAHGQFSGDVGIRLAGVAAELAQLVGFSSALAVSGRVRVSFVPGYRRSRQPMSAWLEKQQRGRGQAGNDGRNVRLTEEARHGHKAERTGWVAYDTGLHGHAERHLALALSFARHAQDDGLGAEILAAKAHQAVYLGRSAEAVGLAPLLRPPPAGPVFRRCWPSAASWKRMAMPPRTTRGPAPGHCRTPNPPSTGQPGTTIRGGCGTSTGPTWPRGWRTASAIWASPGTPSTTPGGRWTWTAGSSAGRRSTCRCWPPHTADPGWRHKSARPAAHPDSSPPGSRHLPWGALKFLQRGTIRRCCHPLLTAIRVWRRARPAAWGARCRAAFRKS